MQHLVVLYLILQVRKETICYIHVVTAFHSLFLQEKIRLALVVQKAAITFIDGIT